MIQNAYDPSLPYRFALYGRMSSRTQNERSPDQQFATATELIRRCGYPWVFVDSYRDDGISGRYVAKRPGLQSMLKDIESGQITIDLIVVDTYERFGRADEIAELRRKLQTRCGILVVAADSNFADPTGVVGKAMGMVEAVRSTEEGRIKGHNVRRGKLDAVRLRRWPGGEPPLGLILEKTVEQTANGPLIHTALVAEPRGAAAMRLTFRRAYETGEGATRLAKWWNTCPEIPDEFKPVDATTMAARLRNQLYIGVLEYGVHSTGIVEDTRIKRRNAKPAERVEGYGPPIIDRELFDAVGALMKERGDRIRAMRAGIASGGPLKLIAPQVTGVTLKYPLTGLVRCGCCGASMRPVPSGQRSKAGRRYVYYSCRRSLEGSCSNRRYVLEDELRAAVLVRLRARLFPVSAEAGEAPAWLPEVMTAVRETVRRERNQAPGEDAARARRIEDLRRQLDGWSQSLSDPQLPRAVRSGIASDYERSSQEIDRLTREGEESQAARAHVEKVLDLPFVLDALRRLAEVLAGVNPMLMNLELARHIDVIACHPDGRVELRGTYLGLFDGACELLSRHAPTSAPPDEQRSATVTVRQRVRTRLALPQLSESADGKEVPADTALDPRRLEGLAAPFMWTDPLVVGDRSSWAKANAEEVARQRTAGMTMERLAEHFSKSIPTIRAALDQAKAQDSTLKTLPTKMPRRRWEEDHAEEVARLFAEGMSMTELVAKFDKSAPTIRKAIRFAENRGHTGPEISPESAG